MKTAVYQSACLMNRDDTHALLGMARRAPGGPPKAEPGADAGQRRRAAGRLDLVRHDSATDRAERSGREGGAGARWHASARPGWPHGVVGSSQVRPIISSHDWRSLTGIGLFVPKPTTSTCSQRLRSRDLEDIIRRCSLASAVGGGDCYSVSHFIWGWSRCVKMRPVRVAAGLGRCRVWARVCAAVRVRQWGRAARDAGATWNANPAVSLALGS